MPRRKNVYLHLELSNSPQPVIHNNNKTTTMMAVAVGLILPIIVSSFTVPFTDL